ncbi:peptidylprolyl isomerase [Blattabacterium cuenoti]|uniref:peptidylprolyl isomerase n=1 Tax=Blattabacterium cuenoti TaxID=1653831 RepID=UPI00163C6EEB|nr:peptidylprolyl isomerase [Blattabacterium cuenoti]
MVNIEKKIFFFTLLLLISVFSFSFEKLGGIYAIIGNEIILNSEIKSSDKKKDCFNEEIFTKKLILYHAKKNFNIQISDKELELKIQEFLSKMSKKYSKDEFLMQFKNKESIEKLKEEIKDHEYIEKYYQYLTRDIETSPKEIKNFLINNKDKIPFIPKKMCISYITFYPKVNQINRKKNIELLKNVKKRIHSDVDFSIQAILMSEDINSALNGGLIRGIKINSLSEKFKRVILSLSEKEISEPFETEIGFHLIKLEKKVKNEVDIRHILIKHKYTKSELETVKSFIHSIKKNWSFNKDFKDLMSQYKNNNIVNYSIKNKVWVGENEISENMKYKLNSLKKGSISDLFQEIINEKETFFIVKLLDSIPSRPVSFEEDYTILKNFVKDVKKNEFIKNWEKEVLKKTYIKCY